jgi:hypothetical protein
MGLIRSSIIRRDRSRDGRLSPAARSPADIGPFVELVYELLDAHADTARLACQLPLDDDWLAHLEYLRALQREGRARLAQLDFRATS